MIINNTVEHEYHPQQTHTHRHSEVEVVNVPEAENDKNEEADQFFESKAEVVESSDSIDHNENSDIAVDEPVIEEMVKPEDELEIEEMVTPENEHKIEDFVKQEDEPIQSQEPTEMVKLENQPIELPPAHIQEPELVDNEEDKNQVDNEHIDDNTPKTDEIAKTPVKVNKTIEPVHMVVDLTKDFEDNDLAIIKTEEQTLDVQNDDE